MTRPGMSMMAEALASEMLVSLVQHIEVGGGRREEGDGWSETWI